MPLAHPVVALHLLRLPIHNYCQMINIKFPHLINKDGFTIIELVVSFSIIAVLSTIGIAAFGNYSRAQTLQQATNNLITTLNTAKARAVAQVKPNDCITPVVKTLSGYKVVLTKNSYRLQAICNGSAETISTTNLAGVSIDTTKSTMTVTFSVLTGVVIGSGSIILDDDAGTTHKTITVTSGGLIE